MRTSHHGMFIKKMKISVQICFLLKCGTQSAAVAVVSQAPPNRWTDDGENDPHRRRRSNGVTRSETSAAMK